MGKKIKKSDIKLSDQELVPSTIGFMEEEKTGPWGLIIIFAVLISVAFFLPEIVNYVNVLLGKTDGETPTPAQVESGSGSGSGDPTPVIEAATYDFSEGLEFTYNDLKFFGFSKGEFDGKYKIGFSVENPSTKDVDFDTEKYFLEIYNGNTMLGRHILDLGNLEKSNRIQWNFEINNTEYDTINKISIVKKEISDYPKFDLTTASGENYILTCNHDNQYYSDNVVYTFNSKYTLTRIRDTYQIKREMPNYDSYVALSGTTASEYNNMSGVASNILETEAGLTMTTDIEVSKTKIDDLNSHIFYSTKAEANVIKFEMESRCYSCN